MYGTYSGNLNATLVPVGASFFCIQLFCDLYNDYQDYDEDIRNNRKDKLTIGAGTDKKKIRNLSFFALFLSIIFLFFTNIFVFALGFYFITIAYLYSNPNVRLKYWGPTKYLILCSPFLLLAPMLNTLFLRTLSTSDIFFVLFIFFEISYIMIQKDSTDLKDRKNTFLMYGWRTSSMICIAFATLALVFLFIMSLSGPWLIFIFALNVLSKLLNISGIWRRKISRKTRGRLVTIEFITPHLYAFCYLL